MRTRTNYLSIFLAVFLVSAVVATSGCTSRPAAAQKLFERGEYQKVIEKYPDLEIARRAEAKMAEKLFSEKQYEACIQQYPQTPAAYNSKMALAQKLFDEGNYLAVIDSFPFSPLVQEAKARMADTLLARGLVDELLTRYPESQKAKEIKEKQAQEALMEAKRLRGDAQRHALEEITRMYGGTAVYKEAMEMLTKAKHPRK